MAAGGRSSTSSISGPGVVLGLVVAVLGLAVGAAYVWNTHALGAEAQDGPVGVEARDVDGDGRAGWIAVTLADDASGPYQAGQVHLELSGPDGTSVIDRPDPISDARDRVLCDEPRTSPGRWLARRACSTSWFESTSLWRAGETLFVPCQKAEDGEGRHDVRLSLDGGPSVDQTVVCGEPAPFGG